MPYVEELKLKITKDHSVNHIYDHRDVKKGDIMLVGRFKNKAVKVKTIEIDDIGQPIINGSPLLKCKLPKTM